jgi:hypothetical protein
MALLYIDKVKENKVAFEAKVRSIAEKLQIDPNWLMLQMFLESGLNPQAQNTKYPVGGGFATGLIQFIPSTAKGLGTTTEALMQLNNVQQLDYVYQYYKPYAGRIKSFEDLYLITFFPAALGYSDDQKISTASISAGSVAGSNPTIDLNKDKVITVGEFKEWVQSKIPFGYKSEFGRQVMTVVSPVTESPAVAIVIVILFIALIYLLYKKSQS